MDTNDRDRKELMPYFKIGEKAVMVNCSHTENDGKICEIISGLLALTNDHNNIIKPGKVYYMTSHSGEGIYNHMDNLRKLNDKPETCSWESMEDIWQPSWMKERV